MKNLFSLLLVLSILPSHAYGKKQSITAAGVKSLIQRVKLRQNRLLAKIQSSGDILEYFISPEKPVQGDSVALYAEVQTDFTGEDLILVGTLDGNAVTLEQPSPDLFIFNPGAFGMIGKHTFSGNIFIQNHVDAANLQNAIIQLNSQIISLQAQIAAATDPAVIAALNAQLTQAQAEQAQLTAALANLKTSIGSQDFSFDVGENNTSPDFGHISGISPNIARVNSPAVVTISGTNFPANPIVTLGGQSVAVSSASATSIVGTAPAFANPGSQDLVITFSGNGHASNAELNDAFFVANAGLVNAPPIAVANAASASVGLGVPATFNSTGSSDPQQGALSYHWQLIATPVGSQLSLPSAGSAATYSITPDAPGTYVVSLTTTSSVSNLSSSPSFVVVSASGANGAPVLTGGSISLNATTSKTFQLQLSDESWQAHSFIITRQPNLGTASVSSSGLVTYSAGSAGGSDSLDVMVFDNGTPPLSATATLSVNVIENHAPTGSAPAINLPGVLIGTSQISAADSDSGQILSYAIQTPPSHGSASVTAQGLVSFNVTPGFTGSDQVMARVADNGVPVKFVDILIPILVSPNTAPTASAPSLSVNAYGTSTSQVLGADQDAGQTLSYSIATAPIHGTASVNASGLVTYTSTIGYSASDSVGVLVTDNGYPALSTSLSIPVSLNGPNDLPPVIPFPVNYHIQTQGIPIQVSLSMSSTGAIVPISDPDGTIQSMVWNFGDGTKEKTFDTSTGSILHNYVNPGVYTATLTVTDNLGLTATSSVQVNVVNTDIPTSKFKVSPSNGGGGTVPLTVTFDASGSSDADGIVQYRWRWSGSAYDDEVTTSPINTHTFTAPGTYSVRVRTRDANRAQGQQSVNVVVGSTSGGIGPVPQFTVGPPREVHLGTAHTFDGSRSFNPNSTGTIASYAWNFNDFVSCPNPNGGCTASGITSSHIYSTQGNFFPSLQVTSGSGGQSGRATQEVFTVLSGHAPKAVMEASAIAGVAPLTINLDGTGSYDYDGTISSYQWIYTDGSNPDATSTTTHTFTTPGAYIVTLQVHDNDGNMHSLAQPISVTASREELASVQLGTAYDPDREYQRQILAGACAQGAGEECSALADMYAEDGDAFTAGKFKQRACWLGYQAACQ